ncbi:DUF1834 family protein [Grimontia kaedaensis]|uniref:DUF1834 family protein n=1 Tax=Grimontia kaedaensis TaxID=2872157 RepID=A0ABY4WNH4_9GAMM|nr:MULTISPECIES: phage protein Gp37 [Grimontia]USH01068.1 DUF1834 family protein [Grimontia kaedaensis]
MRLTALRQAIITTIRAKLPALAAVDSHPGRFNLDELRRIVTRLPAVRVALMAVPDTGEVQTGERDITVRLAAFVMTGDKRRLPKDEAALAIVEALLDMVPTQRWGMTALTGAEKVSAENLFSGSVDKQGVALWAVTWSQTLRIGEDIWQGGVLPSEVYLNDDREQDGKAGAYDKVTP